MAIALGVAGPAHADAPWTWNTATHPAGSGSIGPLGWGSTGGGVWRQRGVYFVPGAGHIDSPLGNWRDEQVTGSGSVGRVAYTTYANGASGYPDIGMISTGTQPIAPKIRVSDGWQDAIVMDVAHPGDIVAGASLCHSGTSPQTAASAGYRCGQALQTCSPPSALCSFTAKVSGGDSGGPVWWYSAGGVKLYGWIHGYDGTSGNGYFVPVWALQDHVWTASESWSSWGYPAGIDTTGCFVTYTGCVRS
ncbi:hypothetical protein A0130_02155 [Leifsonia xyli]|uniref:hypothetical protein n=1 Tax=Leifsonia xyli TaxID=1575 RepID=UPI0007CDBBCC|nr:hypothetical protein A0130_02155 [Leifsonia xyli]